MAVLEPPNSVVLLVGREDFTLPTGFGGQVTVATVDCIAVGVKAADDAPTTVTLVPGAGPSDLIRLGDFTIETEGLLSLRDVYNREHEAIGLEPGPCAVTVWGNDLQQPDQLVVEARSTDL